MATMKEDEIYHEPVLVEEITRWLAPPPGGVVFDLTVGGGGHVAALLAISSADVRVYGVDRDLTAVSRVRERFRNTPQVRDIIHAPFGDLAMICGGLGVEKIDVALLDLGVSSAHLDQSARGFSFQSDGPLDMRMDQSQTLTAHNVIRDYSFEELRKILRDFGEERNAGRIASAIVRERERSEITSTERLRRIVESASPREHITKTLARVFQALRIAVNDELGQLSRALTSVVDMLAYGGRVGVISYHSLEDRLVKNSFRDAANPCVCPLSAPVCVCGRTATLRILTKKPIVPTPEEVARNPRSRSAKFRVAERISPAPAGRGKLQ